MEHRSRLSYKKWLEKFLVIFLALLSCIVLFNVLVDGVGFFQLNAGLKDAVANLLKGKMVAGWFGTRDERELQRLIIKYYQGHRDMAVIGSSRAMQLRKRFIQGNVDFFNHSVSGAGVEDFISIIGIYREKGVLPKTVVLGIDPWIFNRNNGLSQSWKYLEKYFREMMTEIDKTGREMHNRVETNAATQGETLAR